MQTSYGGHHHFLEDLNSQRGWKGKFTGRGAVICDGGGGGGDCDLP